jgi:hypothetical protein
MPAGGDIDSSWGIMRVEEWLPLEMYRLRKVGLDPEALRNERGYLSIAVRESQPHSAVDCPYGCWHRG